MHLYIHSIHCCQKIVSMEDTQREIRGEILSVYDLGENIWAIVTFSSDIPANCIMNTIWFVVYYMYLSNDIRIMLFNNKYSLQVAMWVTTVHMLYNYTFILD